MDEFTPFLIANIIVFLEICLQSDVFPALGPRLLTQPRRVHRIVCPGRYVVLNCSINNTAALIWNVSSGRQFTKIKCYGMKGSSCKDGTNTIYAVIKDTVSGYLNDTPVNNITSSLTITDVYRRIEVNCSHQAGDQARYVLHQSSMYMLINF